MVGSQQVFFDGGWEASFAVKWAAGRRTDQEKRRTDD
jgi:hypothetical protein